MSTISIDPSWGVPIDTYLNNWRPSPDSAYTIGAVRFAIETFTLNRPETISDSTLEAILSVTYYPQLLGLLENEVVLRVWFGIFLQYQQNHSFLERSFGFLLLQVLGLATTVAVLARNNQLNPFVESFSTTHAPYGIDVSPMLKIWTMKYANDSIDKLNIGLLGFEQTLGWKPRENQKPSCLMNIGGFNPEMVAFLLRAMYAARSDILRAHTRIPDFGYSILLVIIWGLRHASDDELSMSLAMLRDNVLRYFLVSSPTEHLIMANLVEEIAHRGKGPYAPPLNSADAEVIAGALIRQLSLHRSNGTPISLRYAATLIEYTLGAIEERKLFDLYGSIFPSAFDRLWHELDYTCQRPDGDFWEHVLVYANLLFYALTSSALPPGLNPQTKAMAFPSFIENLLRIDFINVAAKLILLPSSSIAGSDPKAGDIYGLEATEDTLGSLDALTHHLLKHKELTHSAFATSNLDWLKIYNYFLRLKSMSLPPTHPLRPYLNKCKSTWYKLGEALGCLRQISGPPCAYPRCAGAEMSVVGQYMCEACLRSTYRSTMCQQADWSDQAGSHHFECSQGRSLRV